LIVGLYAILSSSYSAIELFQLPCHALVTTVDGPLPVCQSCWQLKLGPETTPASFTTPAEI